MILALLPVFIAAAWGKPLTTNFKQKLIPPSIEENYAAESAENILDLARYFRESNCAGVLKLAERRDFLKLKPLELAIIASCDPPEKDPEKLFAYAETKDPSDDTILLLHGRYRWKKYKLNSNEIWEKLLKQTKNPEIRELAEQYLDGNGPENSSAFSSKIIKASSIQIGEIYETNPDQLSLSDQNGSGNASLGTNWNFLTSRRTDYSFGYIDWAGSFSGAQYNNASGSNLLAADVSPTFALESNLEQYLIFRPLVNALSLEGKLFNSSAGIAVGELWQYPTFDFKLLFTLYTDRYYQAGLENQGGTHYLIEQKLGYKWNNSLFFINLFWLKTNASEDNSGVGQVIPYSNTTSGLSVGYQWTLNDFVLGGSSAVSFRQDDTDTQFINTSGVADTKKRKEVNTYFEAWGSFKFNSDLSAVLFFSISKTASNFSESEGFDRNLKNSVSGLSLKYSY